MNLSTVLTMQAGVLLSCLPILPVNASAQSDQVHLGPDNEATTLDGPTSDQSASIGVEFKTPSVWFTSPGCSVVDTKQAEGKVVGSREGDEWELTATTLDDGTLYARYKMDGAQIKIGDGTVTAAAAAVSNDIMAWNPFVDMDNNEWNIDGNECNPWKVTFPIRGDRQASISWSTKVTVPLPFEAINDLFVAALSQPDNSFFRPSFRAQWNVVSVTDDFFQSNPNGISPDSVKADVLGFCSLVISYAKGATKIANSPWYSNWSPGGPISIMLMPKTEFVTLYAQVKNALPGSDSLYNLVKVLACYENDGDGVRIDSLFCDGTVDAPTPKAYIDGIGWCLYNPSDGDKDCLLVKDWIASIESGPSPDKLTILDKLIDGQIGGLNTAMDHVVGTTRAVPLFEYRHWLAVETANLTSELARIEQEIIEFHTKYKTAPGARETRAEL